MKKHITTILILSVIFSAFISCTPKAPEQKTAPAMEKSASDVARIKIDPALLASENDLVCGMSVKEEVGDTCSYNGKLYGFCSSSCKDDFLKEPQKYVK